MNDQNRAEQEISCERLLRQAEPQLKRVLARYQIPPADADDLLQNAYLQYLRKRDSVRKPAGWLVGAVRNECRMYWRTHGRRFTVAIDQGLLDLFADNRGPEQERRVLRSNLEHLIGQLKERCQKLLNLRYFEYSAKEIGERTGYKTSSVDKVTRRCLEELSRRMHSFGLRMFSRRGG